MTNLRFLDTNILLYSISRGAYRLSYWDAAIVAAARALGCQELYSEDMSHGREVEGVAIIKPFR